MAHQLILITDLDGTLLDHESYDWSPAREALSRLNRRRIPLILCSSKTAAEMIPLQHQIRNAHPFIVENGGGIYVPHGYFVPAPPESVEKDHFRVISLGCAYPKLQQALESVMGQFGLRTRAFHQLSPETLAEETNLSREEAHRALARDFDLPFLILDPDAPMDELRREFRRRGLTLARGGRFFHLSGSNDKGRAAGRLIELYRAQLRVPLRVVGLGDSENDLALLQAVDVPVVIPNPGSRAPLLERLPRARRAPASGPRGWNAVVLELLRETEKA